MGYDTDKTGPILEELKNALRTGRMKDALVLLRHADAGGKLRNDAGVLAGLRAAVGEKQAASVLNEFAADPCPYCTGGRDKCDDCSGKGYYGEAQVCRPCAGLGLRRCSFCNGTGFAGYDFVPRGLRGAVMSMRLKYAKDQIAALSKDLKDREGGSRETAKHILAIDRCRGILANAVEQARLNEIGAPGGRQHYPPAERARIEKESRALNKIAEEAIRVLLRSLGQRFADKAQRLKKGDENRALLGHRAKVFTQLAAAEDFGKSALRTPGALATS